MPRSSAETREHVLAVARDLFYWHGIRATGVDTIASEAGVSTTTLYRLFASKDALVAAYVEREGRLYREWFETATAGPPDRPRERLLALFGALAEQVTPRDCRGCPFQMALAELPDPDGGGHRLAAGTKAWVRARLGELTAQLAGVADPAALADSLMLVLEGVYASAPALGADGPARRARAVAEALLPAQSGS
jgi:AcrR family transcriptional regulator